MKRPGARCYLPDEIAYAVLRLEQGLSLAQAAVELGRDRSGLLRMLKALGYPTKPERLNPEEAKSRVEERIADMKTLSPQEIKERILQLRRQGASSSTAARPSSLNPANP